MSWLWKSLLWHCLPPLWVGLHTPSGQRWRGGGRSYRGMTSSGSRSCWSMSRSCSHLLPDRAGHIPGSPPPASLGQGGQTGRSQLPPPASILSEVHFAKQFNTRDRCWSLDWIVLCYFIIKHYALCISIFLFVLCKTLNNPSGLVELCIPDMANQENILVFNFFLGGGGG